MEAETETAVDVDIHDGVRSSSTLETPQRSRSNWKMGVIRKIFHVSPENKMAMKMYGTKKAAMKAQEDQDRTCCVRWMIHPCSYFK